MTEQSPKSLRDTLINKGRHIATSAVTNLLSYEADFQVYQDRELTRHATHNIHTVTKSLIDLTNSHELLGISRMDHLTRQPFDSAAISQLSDAVLKYADPSHLQPHVRKTLQSLIPKETNNDEPLLEKEPSLSQELALSGRDAVQLFTGYLDRNKMLGTFCTEVADLVAQKSPPDLEKASVVVKDLGADTIAYAQRINADLMKHKFRLAELR